MKLFSLKFQISASLLKYSVSSCQRKLLPKQHLIRLCHNETTPANFIADIKPVTLQRITKILQTTDEEAIEAINNVPAIKKITEVNLVSRCQFLTERNITNEMILKHPWLLTENKRLLEIKLALLQNQTTSDLSSTVGLLKMPVPELKKFLQQNILGDDEKHTERIKFLAKHLQCDDKASWELLQKYRFLLTIPLDRMEAVLALLKEYKIEAKDIRRDPYILRYFPEVLQPRLEEIRETGMKKIKPWLARSQKDVFHRSLERYKAIQEQLGSDPSITQFLIRKLELQSPDQVTEIMRSFPLLLSCSPKKLGLGINALKKEGYTSQQISNYPRVLRSSIPTLLGRLKILRSLMKRSQPQLYLLYVSKKEFCKFITRLSNTSKTKLH